MAEHNFDTRRMTRDQERRAAAATAIALNAVKPILQFQVALLRLWADNIEAFAHKYEKGLGAEVEQQEQQRRVA
jgi:hypothetical protein